MTILFSDHFFLIMITAIVMAATSWGTYLARTQGTETAGTSGPESTTVGMQIGVIELQKLFDERLKRYGTDVKKLNQNIGLQVGLVVISLAMALTHTETFVIPGLGLELPRQLLYFAVPPSLLYLWTQCGHLLGGAIGNRIAAWRLLDLMHDPRGDPVISRRPLLHDRGIVDLYFLRFHADLHALGEKSKGLHVVIFGAYAVFFGATHAVIIGFLYLAARNAFFGGAGPVWWGTYLTVDAICLSILLWTHYQFAIEGNHPNWGHHIAAVFGIMFLYLLLVALPAGSG